MNHFMRSVRLTTPTQNCSVYLSFVWLDHYDYDPRWEQRCAIASTVKPRFCNLLLAWHRELSYVVTTTCNYLVITAYFYLLPFGFLCTRVTRACVFPWLYPAFSEGWSVVLWLLCKPGGSKILPLKFLQLLYFCSPHIYVYLPWCHTNTLYKIYKKVKTPHGWSPLLGGLFLFMPSEATRKPAW